MMFFAVISSGASRRRSSAAPLQSCSIINFQFSIFNFNCTMPLQSFALSLFIGIHLMLSAFANSTILLTLAKWWAILNLQTASAPMN